MDPQDQFCHNEGCRAYGRKAEGHIVIHISTERRYQCKRCKKTFRPSARRRAPPFTGCTSQRNWCSLW
jgi:hypothetical protein